MASSVPKITYSRGEEIAHTASHALGFLIALVAALFMVAAAAQAGDMLSFWAIGVYSLSMLLLFAASTLYHGAFGSSFQPFYKLLDHMAIFAKIAGSYTPFALLVLPREKGIWILASVWLFALLGMGLKLVAYCKGWLGRDRRLSLVLYLGMGWVSIFILQDLFVLLPAPALLGLGVGGLLYTLGAIFYAIKSIPMGHFIWHIFVVLASSCHMATVYFYLLPGL